jgi:hypothetical protein
MSPKSIPFIAVLNRSGALFLLLLLLLACQPNATWEGNSNRLRTYTPNDWDYWNYNIDGVQGQIRTYTPSDWDYWSIDNGNYTLRTYTPNDWDDWVLSGNGLSVRFRTYTPSDWDYWQASGSATGTFRTYTPNDWDDWEIEGDWAQLDASTKASLLFLPVLVATLKEQGIL